MLLNRLSLILLLTPAALMPSGKPAKTLQQIRRELAAQRVAANNANDSSVPRPSTSYAIGDPAAHLPVPENKSKIPDSKQEGEREDRKEPEQPRKQSAQITEEKKPLAKPTQREEQKECEEAILRHAQDDRVERKKPKPEEAKEQEKNNLPQSLVDLQKLSPEEFRAYLAGLRSNAAELLQKIVGELPDEFLAQQQQPVTRQMIVALVGREIDRLLDVIDDSISSDPLFNAVDSQDIQDIAQFFQQHPDSINKRDRRRLTLINPKSLMQLFNKTLAIFKKVRPGLITGAIPIASRLDVAVDSLNSHEWQTLRELFLFIFDWFANSHNGFTPLMRFAAANHTAGVELCIAKKADLYAKVALCPWMVDRTIKINIKQLMSLLFKDAINVPSTYWNVGISNGARWLHRMVTRVYESSISEDGTAILSDTVLGKNREIRHGELISDLDALSLAAIGGHQETVALLTEALLDGFANKNDEEQQNCINSIYEAIHKLILYSDLISTDVADGLLEAMGIREKPTHDQYKAIVCNLIEAARIIYEIKVQIGNGAYYREKISKTFENAIKHGTTDMLQVIAESLADLSGSLSIQWLDLIQHSTCGEKLAVLFTVDAAPGSLIAQLREFMLTTTEHNQQLNPIFLNRLKEFIREQQSIKLQMDHMINPELPPVLSDLVRGYASAHHRQLPAEVIQRIFACWLQKETIMARLKELLNACMDLKLRRQSDQIYQVLLLHTTQPYTADTLAMSLEMLAQINPKTKIQYFGGPTEISILLQPIVNDIKKEIERLRSVI